MKRVLAVVPSLFLFFDLCAAHAETMTITRKPTHPNSEPKQQGSGKRINTPTDDSAGLAISQKMKEQMRELDAKQK